MRNDDYSPEWNRINASETKSGPFVKEIILPPSLYSYALERGGETYKEVGFYLVGFFKKGICYIYDLIEFDYSEQSGGFIESGMKRYLRLRAGIPVGLRIVGHMHKHPGFTQYSATDKRNFLRYGNANPLNAFLIYMVDPYPQISGYTATSEKIFPVSVIIRELTSDEELLEKELKIAFSTKVLLPKKTNLSDFNLLFSENIGSETLKVLSRPTIQFNEMDGETASIITEKTRIRVIPRKAVEIEGIGKNKKLRYRIFMEETEIIADLEKILTQLVDIQKQKGYDLVFYENGQKLSKNTKIKEIRLPLTWDLEKSPLLPIFSNFYQFWRNFFKIISQKLVQSEEIASESSESQISKLEKPYQDSELKKLFVNFSKFWKDIFKLSEKKKSEPEMKTIQEFYELDHSETKKKQRESRGDTLDYYI